jgi:CHAT domain-containing protein/predicted negative regulator of RcsB-dependent stress response
LTDQSPENESIDIADNYYRAGKFKEEINYYKEKLANVQSKEDEAYWSLVCGDAHRDSGKFQLAKEYYDRAFSVYTEIKDKRGEAGCYLGIGSVYVRTGNLEKAIEIHKKALHISKQYEYRDIESKSYISLGFDHSQIEHFQEAIEYYFDGLKIIEREIAIEAKRDEQKMACYGNIGIAYMHLQKYCRAFHFHHEGLKIARKLGNKYREAIFYHELGNTFRSQGKIQEAIEFYNKALEIDNETDDVDGQRFSNAALGQIYYENNRLQEAYRYLKRSIDLAELIATELIQDEYKMGFYGHTSNAYRLMINTCLRLGCNEEAFQYLERGKSRALISMLAASELTPSPVHRSKEIESLITKEKNLLQSIRKIQKRYLNHEESLPLNQDSDSLLKELETIYDKIEKVDPEYVSIRKAKPISLEMVQELLSKSGDNAVLIEYFVTSEKTFIFVITHKGIYVQTAKSNNLDLTRERLSRYVVNYVKEVVDYVNHGDIGNTWLELSAYLLNPISDHLSEADLIFFIPHHLLHYLPLHALQLNGEPIIKNHPIVYSQSASLLQFHGSRDIKSLETCSAFAVREGQEEHLFSKEAQEIASLFNSHAFIDVSKVEVLKNIDRDILHFATHGYFDSRDPVSSGIQLKNETLTAREIFNQRLNAKLVTLSACQTGVNERKPGDELIGLTRSLLYAGARSVIVSLWSVYEESTLYLMREFYFLLRNEQGDDMKLISKARALQMAQNRTMEKYPHPFFWAPFILIGDWQ